MLALLRRGCFRWYLLFGRRRCGILLEHLGDDVRAAIKEALPVLQATRITEVPFVAGVPYRSHRNRGDLALRFRPVPG